MWKMTFFYFNSVLLITSSKRYCLLTTKTLTKWPITIVGYILTDFSEVWWDICYQVLIAYTLAE